MKELIANLKAEWQRRLQVQRDFPHQWPEILGGKIAFEIATDEYGEAVAALESLTTTNQSLMAEVPKWISVKDRLPITQADMDGKNYELIEGLFVLTGSNGIARSDFAAGNTIGYWGRFHYESDVITHWLEISIPAPPQALHAEDAKQ